MTEQIIFAKLTDKPGLAACAVFNNGGVRFTEVLLPTDHAQLPSLTASAAGDVYCEATDAGAYLDVAALVLQRRGYDAMVEYCEWQSLSGMRKDFLAMPEDQRKWKYSGFTSFEQEEACAG